MGYDYRLSYTAQKAFNDNNMASTMILPDVHLSPNKTINTLASVPAPDLSPVLTSMLYVVVVMVDVTVSAGRTL